MVNGVASVGERWVAWVDCRQTEARRRREANKPPTLQQQRLRLAYKIIGPVAAVMGFLGVWPWWMIPVGMTSLICWLEWRIYRRRAAQAVSA